MIFEYLKSFLSYFSYLYYKIFKTSRTFRVQGETYTYFCHRYNGAWINERAVEVPIIWKIIKENKGKNILEVGNVLSHYFSVNHDILDKYEKAEGIINEDVINFRPSKKYDLIVSISTLEHVGWDESPREPRKILLAIDNLRNILTEEGKIVVTLPMGYNHDMDKLLKKREIPFDKALYLKRVSKESLWIEAEWKEIKDLSYNSPFISANGLVIGFINKK